MTLHCATPDGLQPKISKIDLHRAAALAKFTYDSRRARAAIHFRRPAHHFH